MKDAVLHHFRDLADTLAGPEPRNWQWIGPHVSQRMFGIPEGKARTYAARHGGVAQRMPDVEAARVGSFLDDVFGYRPKRGK